MLLFAHLDVLGVAWLRIAAAALMFAVWRRPWRALRTLDRAGRGLLLAWGASLAAMNALLLPAIDRLPLGTVAAIEFLPVIVAGRARRPHAAQRRRAAAGRAGRLPADRRPDRGRAARARLRVRQRRCSSPLYIVLADRVAKHPSLGGIDGLAAAMLVARVCVTPIGGWQALPAFAEPLLLLAGIGVGISSSVIPYVADQLALARLARATYALMVSLLPATATVIGIVVLAQVPSARRAGRHRARRRRRRPAPRAAAGGRRNLARLSVAV